MKPSTSGKTICQLFCQPQAVGIIDSGGSRRKTCDEAAFRVHCAEGISTCNFVPWEQLSARPVLSP